MLLLLMAVTKFQLKDQFEIWQGITVAQTKEKDPELQLPSQAYKLVNLSGIDPCSRQIDDEKLLEYYPARDIKTNKLLKRCDYLISCKGEVKGYSMLYSENVFKEIEKTKSSRGLVASNHFLVLRPRMVAETSINELRFLHNLLDILIPSLKKLASEKGGKAKYLNINDVADYTFNFPYSNAKELENFNSVIAKYNSRLNDLTMAKRDLDEYNKSLEHKIRIDD